METGAEAPIQTESKPIVGKKDYAVAGNKVEVTSVKFDGQENPAYDPKKAAFLLTGYPMRADAQITWGHPAILAKEFGVTTYEIDGRPKGNFEGNTIDLELEGIRQFAAELEQTGINEIILFGHSIGASKAVDLAVALEEKNPNLKINVVLINPLGLYPQDFRTLAKNYIIDAPKVEGRTKNPDRIFQGRLSVLVDICASLFKDLNATKLRYPRLFADQRSKLTQFNSNLARVKSPVLIMLASDDPVIQLEKLFPEEQMDKITPHPQPNETSQDRMTRISKAREQYFRQNVLPKAADVSVIVATKYANHIAFGVERPRSTSHIMARHFDRLKR